MIRDRLPRDKPRPEAQGTLRPEAQGTLRPEAQGTLRPGG